MITAEDLYADEDGGDTFVEQEPLEDNLEQNQDEDEGNTTGQVVKAKRVSRNPRLKLNDQVLQGKRGLTALPSYFGRVKYKGKGCEEQDLNAVLKTYEYWCHRLFPKYPFDSCIERIEKLGAKRTVQTHIKKIRMDMISDLDTEPQGVIDDEPSEDEQLPAGNHLDIEFDNLIQMAEATTELTDAQEAQIKANKERAEQRRRERLQQRVEQERVLAASSVSEDPTTEEIALNAASLPPVQSEEFEVSASVPPDDL